MVTARRAEATDGCRLCRKPSVLQDSHVVPEWGYGPLYDDKHRMIALRSGSRRPASADYMQKGIRERLLCKRCETRLSRYEKYARDLLMTRGLVLPPPRRQVVNQADYKPLKLFQLSLLWHHEVTAVHRHGCVTGFRAHHWHTRPLSAYPRHPALAFVG